MGGSTQDKAAILCLVWFNSCKGREKDKWVGISWSVTRSRPFSRTLFLKILNPTIYNSLVTDMPRWIMEMNFCKWEIGPSSLDSKHLKYEITLKCCYFQINSKLDQYQFPKRVTFANCEISTNKGEHYYFSFSYMIFGSLCLFILLTCQGGWEKTKVVRNWINHSSINSFRSNKWWLAPAINPAMGK